MALYPVPAALLVPGKGKDPATQKQVPAQGTGKQYLRGRGYGAPAAMTFTPAGSPVLPILQMSTLRL